MKDAPNARDAHEPYGYRKVERFDSEAPARIVGLSKTPRVVDAFARRLPVQERRTTGNRDCIPQIRRPSGHSVSPW